MFDAKDAEVLVTALAAIQAPGAGRFDEGAGCDQCKNRKPHPLPRQSERLAGQSRDEAIPLASELSSRPKEHPVELR